MTNASVITLGQPTLYLKHPKGAAWTSSLGELHFSYVSFSFMRGQERVNLYNRGNAHPELRLSESDVKLTLDYDPVKATADVVTLLEEKILAEVDRIISNAELRINRGAHSHECLYYFEPSMKHPIKGLHFDPKAIACCSWFEPKRQRA